MKIIISCAFIDELTYFKEKYSIDPNKEQNILTIKKNQVLLLNTGVGKVNSAMNLQKAIDTFQPDFILNSGCSGALTNEIPLYSIILSDYVLYHDFTPVEIMNRYVPDQGKIKGSQTLIDLVHKATIELILDSVLVGTIASGDCYVSDQDIVNRILETGAVAVDMESAAIGHVARANQIPFLCIRSISDFADGQNQEEENAAYKAAQLTEKLIELL